MSEPEMKKLVDMIIVALVSKQKELDKEFLDSINEKQGTAESDMVNIDKIDGDLAEDMSKKESLYIRLQNLYNIQKNILKDENYEAAAEISKTINELKKRLNEM